MDSLIGKTGRVLTAADEQTLSGKVSIEGQIFSAKIICRYYPGRGKVKLLPLRVCILL
jgi:hypothetical protein